MVGFDLEFFKMFSELLGSEGSSIVCYKFLHNNTTVEADLLETGCCFKGLVSVEVGLHLGVDVSRGVIHKDASSTVKVLVIRSPS